jgi:hypothetical protein
MKGPAPLESVGQAGEAKHFGAIVTFVVDIPDQGLRSYREKDQHRASEGKKERINIRFEAIH